MMNYANLHVWKVSVGVLITWDVNGLICGNILDKSSVKHLNDGSTSFLTFERTWFRFSQKRRLSYSTSTKKVVGIGTGNGHAPWLYCLFKEALFK